MVKNILILGNGFDLAMGRKTSYGDFLRFLNSLSFLLSCQEVCNQQLDAKNYDFLLKEYNNLNIASLTKEELQEQIKRKNMQIKKKVDSLHRKNNFQEAENLEKFIVNIWEENHAISHLDKISFQEEFKFYEKLPDKVKLGLLLECLSNFFKNEQLGTFFEENRNDESANGLVRSIIITGDELLEVRSVCEKKDDIESKYLLDVDIIGDLIQKIGKEYKWLLKIRDNLFLKYINENKYKIGEKWSSIELVISDIAEAISYLKKHLEEFSQIFSNGSDELTKIQEKFITKPNFAALSFVTNYQLGQRFDYGSMGFQKVMDKCNEECIQALEELTDYLEFYLTYLDKLDFDSEQRIVKQDSSLDAIEGLENAKVLTFNYTDTTNRLFGIPEENTHFIHGRIDFTRKQKLINTMVFGIEDKEEKTENINPDLISYQKFYQRIIKETGSDYRKFFATIEDSDNLRLKPIDDMNIIVFGHSVDPLDKEIFINCFDLAQKRGGKYKFIFNYYDEKAKREIVKNLTIILGKERMISLTAEQKVAFVKCDDIQRMERELL
ncbi:AbiH family protein [Streptococcus infantarius]|uniref:AbiH family protein n=1 Tax=Streptococcus infantarius TaxID=102684 RepID=UPI0022E5EB3B|nr:AbiH family protein [Streptococcus infantarius]